MNKLFLCAFMLCANSLFAQPYQCLSEFGYSKTMLVKGMLEEPYSWPEDSTAETRERTEKGIMLIPELKLCDEELDEAFNKQFLWVDLNHDGMLDVILKGPCLESTAFRVYMAERDGRYKRVLRENAKVINIGSTESCSWIITRKDACCCDHWTETTCWVFEEGFIKPSNGFTLKMHSDLLAQVESNPGLKEILENPLFERPERLSSRTFSSRSFTPVRSSPEIDNIPRTDSCTGDKVIGNVIEKVLKPPSYWFQPSNAPLRLGVVINSENSFVIGYIE